jgi:hypothetical protein
MKFSGTIIKDFIFSKFGKFLIFGASLILLSTAVVNLGSVKNTCKREVQDFVKNLPAEITTNKVALESVKKQELERCLDEGTQPEQ